MFVINYIIFDLVLYYYKIANKKKIKNQYNDIYGLN